MDSEDTYLAFIGLHELCEQCDNGKIIGWTDTEDNKDQGRIEDALQTDLCADEYRISWCEYIDDKDDKVAGVLDEVYWIIVC